VAVPTFAWLRQSVAPRLFGATNSAAGKNSNFNFGASRSNLGAMLAPNLSKASRWQQPDPALKRTRLRHTA